VPRPGRTALRRVLCAAEEGRGQSLPVAAARSQAGGAGSAHAGGAAPPA